MFTKVHIHKHYIGLHYREGELIQVLQPGKHRLMGFGHRVDAVSCLPGLFQHANQEILLDEPLLAEHLDRISLSDEQRALVWVKNRLAWILGPGEHGIFKSLGDYEVETYTIEDLSFEHKRMDAILGHKGSGQFLEYHFVESGFLALLFRNGSLVRTLKPGRHVFWKQTGKLRIESVDQREQSMDVAGQEIMTADKVTLRINMLISFTVVDTLKAVMAVTDYRQALYREAQLQLRAAVGTRELEKLLADKDLLGNEVLDTVKVRMKEMGLNISSVGVRDIILPGDMKVLLNRVTEARKAAEANLIHRREETAAMRSQVNTAKLIAENPILMKLKELEAVQDIMSGTNNTFYFGRGEITKQLREIVGVLDS